jgi:hypothetical protein
MSPTPDLPPRRHVLGFLLATLGSIAHPRAARAAPPGPGSPAPDFALVGTDGRTHRLADFAGTRGLVLAWFPKAFTSG